MMTSSFKIKMYHVVSHYHYYYRPTKFKIIIIINMGAVVCEFFFYNLDSATGSTCRRE